MTKINNLKCALLFLHLFFLGPTTYNPVFKKSCFIPSFVKASKRFKDSKEITPGPATYEVCQKYFSLNNNIRMKKFPERHWKCLH